MAHKRSVAMKLVVEALNQLPSIDTIDDRKRLQKLVYLAQAFGVNLGYRYGWYVKGPYSSELADDYYDLPESNVLEGKVMRLGEDVLRALEPVRTLVNSVRKPENMPVSNWLELVSSVHYLGKTGRMTTEQIEAKLKAEKSHVSDYFTNALEALSDVQNGQALQ